MNNIENQKSTAESSLPVEERETSVSKQMSRREALAILGKHAVYTTPAVLAIMSLKSKSAHAASF